MKIQLQLDSTIQNQSVTLDFPAAPSMGDTLVYEGARYIVIKVVWVMDDSANTPEGAQVVVAATAK